MSIDLTPETEHLVREEIRSGHFRSVDELIVCGVHAWREKNGSTAASLATLNSEAMLEIDGLWVHQGQADPDADWNGIISNVREERISDFTRFSGSGVFFPIHQFWWRLPSAAIRTTSTYSAAISEWPLRNRNCLRPS